MPFDMTRLLCIDLSHALGVFVHHLYAVFDNDPVVTGQGHHIPDGPDGDDIELFLEVDGLGEKTPGVENPPEGQQEEECDPAGGKVPGGKDGIFPFRIDDCTCKRQIGAGLMMIDDDGIDAAAGGMSNLLYVGGPTIEGYDERDPLSPEGVDSLQVETVPFLTGRDVYNGVHVKMLEKVGHEHC